MRAVELPPPHLVHDVGGQDVHGGRIAHGRLLRGGFVTPYSPTDVARLRQHGLLAVLDLRSDREAGKVRQGLADEPGLSYRRVPIGDEASRPQPGRYGSLTELYAGHLSRHGAALAQAVAFVVRPRDGAVLVHCRTGRDRTGLVVSLALSLAGLTPREVLAHHARAAETVAPTVARRRASWLAKGKDLAYFDAMNSDAVPALAAALEWLATEHGTVADYLRAHGAPPDLPRLAAAALTALPEGNATATGARP
ncbi:tyrosine-protein phosphatase [Streptomyces sp. DSM 44915]|uniref:Tyrosine-protein phosphatase n=1 Tax=Streptomyces chisholmiae TaxID=3075540 RepID=A0ABU2JUT1_9ACTN|nr:tyrosine-protein phosphatase [Streptomyces sp. DSM 44915]MDT0268657.1 tyrosine-protein phosphatase [Streptomyces sp. DSM 44915]